TDTSLEIDEKQWRETTARETRTLQHALTRFTRAYQANVKIVGQLQTAKSLGDLAAQVAHDMRAPLAALDAVFVDARSLPENRRRIVTGALQSIKDTANKLLAQYRLD